MGCCNLHDVSETGGDGLLYDRIDVLLAEHVVRLKLHRLCAYNPTNDLKTTGGVYGCRWGTLRHSVGTVWCRAGAVVGCLALISS